MGDPFVAYHGVKGAKHQDRFDDLSKSGHRMISLSVYGDSDDPLYAAVWVKRSGPAWRAVHGLSSAKYQATFNKLTGEGFVPVLLSVTGPASDPVFAGTFEKMSAPAWLCKFGLTDGPASIANTLASVNKWALQNNCIPRSLSIYGAAASRVYAGVWLPNTQKVKWKAHGMGTAQGYQTWFNDYAELPFRPDLIDLSGDHFYVGMFRDDSVGTWVARHGLTAENYQKEFDKQVKAGLMPISVQGGGGDKIRYAAVFAAGDKPVARKWNQVSSAGNTLDGIHKVMKAFMQAHNVRAGSLAVRKGSTAKLTTGYTWAEPGYPVTQANSLFRMASVSKAFTCAAIQRLVDDGSLKLDQPIFPLLGITKAALPSQQPSKWINSVTVRHCVDLQGGWDSGLANFDAVFAQRSIARALSLNGPAAKEDLARYMYGEPLQFEPGTDSKYSNLGYVLLGLVVERLSHKSFQDYVRQQILAPIGVTDVFTSATPRAKKRPDEVTYDDPNFGLSAASPWSDDKVPYCYGGEGWTTEGMDSGGGLCASTSAVATFIGSHAVWGLGGRAPGAARSGGMAGVASFAKSRGDGIDWCYVLNTRTLPKGPLDALAGDLDTAITAAKL